MFDHRGDDTIHNIERGSSSPKKSELRMLIAGKNKSDERPDEASLDTPMDEPWTPKIYDDNTNNTEALLFPTEIKNVDVERSPENY